MCGIVGIFSQKPVALQLYDSLIHLQHRGQDAAGILTGDGRFYVKHGLGLVREVFSAKEISHLYGNIGIAHTRYPTAGSYRIEDTQPLWIGSPRGIALAHNGNLVNYRELADELTQQKNRHLNSTTDSEVLLHLLADGLEQDANSADEEAKFFETLCKAIQAIFNRAEGSFSVVSLIIGKGMVAFRDPHGIRPLAFGERTGEGGKKDYIFASETTMFYPLDFQRQADVQPGEVIFINQSGQLFRRVIEQKSFNPCVFEYVYFARPDSVLNNISVYHTRLEMGKKLAKRWLEAHPNILPDVVIPAPFTSNTAASAFASEIGVRYAEGLYKNAFIGRTFIMPDHESRSRNVRYKLTPQQAEIEGKNVLILDDSIVRGTTSREIVKMVREFGAKEIYFVSTCPPLKFPCFYGIDIPSRKELLAANLSIEEVRKYLGVDVLLYQEIEDLVHALIDGSQSVPPIKRPCLACLDGKYVCGAINEEKMQRLENDRQLERDKL